MDPITLRFTPASADYDRAQLALENKSQGAVFGACLIYGLLFAVLLAALVYFREPDGSLNSQTTMILILAGAAVLAIGIGVPLQYRKKFRDNPQLTMPVTWEADEEGVLIINDRTRVHQAWRNFREAVESPDYLYLIDAQNEKNFLFLTKQTLDSDQQLAAFRELLRQKVGLRAIGKKH